MLLTTTINYFFVDLRWLGWRRWWYNLKLAYPAYPRTTDPVVSEWERNPLRV